jgi:hypothetical protein
MTLWQPKMMMEEPDKEYNARKFAGGFHVGRRYITEEIYNWLLEHKISFRRDYDDSIDIRYRFRKPEEEVLFKLKFGE